MSNGPYGDDVLDAETVLHDAVLPVGLFALVGVGVAAAALLGVVGAGGAGDTAAVAALAGTLLVGPVVATLAGARLADRGGGRSVTVASVVGTGTGYLVLLVLVVAAVALAPTGVGVGSWLLPGLAMVVPVALLGAGGTLLQTHVDRPPGADSAGGTTVELPTVWIAAVAVGLLVVAGVGAAVVAGGFLGSGGGGAAAPQGDPADLSVSAWQLGRHPQSGAYLAQVTVANDGEDRVATTAAVHLQVQDGGGYEGTADLDLAPGEERTVRVTIVAVEDLSSAERSALEEGSWTAELRIGGESRGRKGV